MLLRSDSVLLLNAIGSCVLTLEGRNRNAAQWEGEDFMVEIAPKRCKKSFPTFTLPFPTPRRGW